MFKPLSNLNQLKFAVYLSLLFAANTSALAGNPARPEESVAANQHMLSEVGSATLPAAGFNPLTASDDDLVYFGFPPRPDATKYPDKHQHWQRAVSIPTQYLTPEFQATTLENRPHAATHAVTTNAITTNATRAASHNWSGYAAYTTSGAFKTNNSTIMTEFTVPSVSASTCNNSWEYASQWVGFDGYNSNDVLQAGVETDAICAGTSRAAFYSFWIEWYPYSEVRISNLPVSAGDTVEVIVWYTTSAPNGHAYIANLTKKVAVSGWFNQPSGTTFVGNSAEWIVEAPTVNGSLATIPNFGSVTLIDNAEGAFTTNGFQGATSNWSTVYPGACDYGYVIYDISMVSATNTVLVSPALSGISTIKYTQY
jgi:hypothetical protein